jgi:hypothetical protein
MSAIGRSPHSRDEHSPELDPVARMGDVAMVFHDGLALVYQKETADGKKSNFNKLVSRHD